MMYSFGFDDFGTRRFVKFGASLAGCDQLLLQLRDNRRVFTVGGNDNSKFFSQLKRCEQFFIVDAKGRLSSQKNFE